MAEQTFMEANEDIKSTVAESASDATSCRAKVLLNTVGKPAPDTRWEIERILADLSFVIEADVEPIVENRFTKMDQNPTVADR